MKVDFLSDLHVDSYFGKNRIKDEDIYRLYNPVITKDSRTIGDVLIVAGDLGHFNFQNIYVLTYLQKNYYKNIICVLGNHDYYLLDHDATLQFEDSFKRVENMRNLIKQEKGIHCLNANVVEIDGVKFGGTDSWYDNGYIKRNKKGQGYTEEIINDMWKNAMHDSIYLKGVKNYDDIYKIELSKIKDVYKSCDVMITHVSPSTKNEHFNYKYRDSKYNVFFSFEGEKFLKNTTAKYWIYGHTHISNNFQEYGVICKANPLGYPGESDYGNNAIMGSFEI